MSAPFAPGDVVVCVDASPSEFHRGESVNAAIRRGSVHRVTAIEARTGGVLIDNEKPHTCACCDGASGWRSERFRHIDDEVTEDFREQMRSLGKPKKLRVDELADLFVSRSLRIIRERAA